MQDNISHDVYMTDLPIKGWTKEKILEEVNHYSKYGT